MDVSADDPGRAEAVTGGLPVGTVTMLFSDMEGSTLLLRELGDRYREVVSAQRRVIRGAVAAHGGRELGTEGDSFFVVFASAAEGLDAAVAAQRALTAHSWPDGSAVRVRMGLHTGEPVRHEDGYVGLDVHRAARVAAIAHGGQILLTAATWALAAPSTEGISAADLGHHRLKDLPEPEHLLQVVGPGLTADFPPPRSLGSAAGVPQPLTSLVGRDRERAEVARLVTGDVRVLTLTGPGGVGKTRLATAVAGEVAERFPDGVYVVPLAAVRSAVVMVTTIAETLGVTGADLTPAALQDHVRPRRMLLVLDNLEQIDGAAAVVGDLAASAPGLRVLATSRRPLHLLGEQELAVPPLALPGVDPGGAAGAGGPAVELFVDRARLVRPGFTLTADHAEHVAEICRRLDGLPLAIELVAARSKLLGPRALLARLTDTLAAPGSLTGLPDRQQTLGRTIGWSYELLAESRRDGLRRLSVFDGETSVEDVAAVVDPATDPLDLLTDLVDASLLTARDGPDGEPRFRMLRTVAEFARQRLAESGVEAEVRRRHAEHLLGVVEEHGPRLRGPNHLTARDRIGDRLQDLRAALRWTLDDGADVDLGLRLCAGLSWFWYGCGHPSEGRLWLANAVSAATGAESAELITALHGLAVLQLEHGDAEQARDMLERCLEFWRARDEDAEVSKELNSLGVTYRVLGDPGRARASLLEAIEAGTRAGSLLRRGNALSNLGVVEMDRGGHARALGIFEEVLEIMTRREDAWGVAVTHVNLVGALLRGRRLEDAAVTLREHGPAIVSLGDEDLTAIVLEHHAVLAALDGRDELAGRLFGASRELRRRSDVPLPAPDEEWLLSAIDPVRGRLGAVGWSAAVGDGSGLEPDEALALADAAPG